MGEGVWSNRHITFIVAEKSLFSCSSYGICGGRELVEIVIWGRGWLKTTEYRLMERGV